MARGEDRSEDTKRWIRLMLDMAADRLGAERAKAADPFIHAFFRDIPPDDLDEMPADAAYGAALGLWEFAQHRHAGVPAIRLYNPTYDEQGWHTRHTVVEIVNDDMPFLVDSITSALAHERVTVHLVVHPVARVSRDVDGNLQDLKPLAPEIAVKNGESLMHLQIDELTDRTRLRAVEARLLAVLKDVRAVVEDFKPMKAKAAEIVSRLTDAPPPVDGEAVRETAAFLSWLADDHFTFLGYREYAFEQGPAGLDLKIQRQSGLGVLRDTKVSVFEHTRDYAQLPEPVQAFMREPFLLMLTKANRQATVHRSVHMDTVIIKTLDDEGKVLGEQLFVGLLTSTAYNEPTRTIPYLRRKTRRILENSAFDPAGHNGKALQNILDSYPRDELFQIGEEELYHTAVGILHLQERQKTAIFVRRDPYGRYVSCLIFVPRDNYNTQMRGTFQRLLEKAFKGRAASKPNVLMTEGVHARIHMIVRLGEDSPTDDVDLPALEKALEKATRGWVEQLQEALVDAKGEEVGLSLDRTWGRAFPTAYRERWVPEATLGDIERLEGVARGDGIGLSLYRPVGADPSKVRFKLYHEGDPVPLSDVLPVLEHFGFRVISEDPYEVRPDGRAASIWIHDFAMESRGGDAIDMGAVKPRFQDAFAKVWSGEMEDDGFNALVALAGIAWRDVVVLRAYSKFLKQAAIPFSQDLQEETLVRYAPIAKALVSLFNARFDPNLSDADRATQGQGARVEIDHALEEVESLAEDRILRRFLNAIESTLRTNFFQVDADGAPKTYVSCKFDSEKLSDLPLPRPWREIFVYSPRVEGVHLRTGPVARGGLRWSDRREDFRTEVLDLVKAQKVKNAVIVPVGSKGGFFVKRPPADRTLQRDEGISCYQIFIRGLLDITDNRIEQEIVPPPNVVRHDDPDPYLVVAADKGTATFSDIANAISVEYGFWLGDAFASGGSAGYDHKKMGITAKGAWESVKRHFREMGHDTQTQPFTAAGVGDMSGDVFGNGMLLSEQIRLQAAFNHRHIFLDPDPDPASSFAERMRLFELGRGSWDLYNEKLLSKGGGIFDRSARAVALTPEMKRMLGVSADRVTPAEVMTAILKMKVDLLWFGGIGTYIKAAEQSHADVGDKANDTIRVNGREVRAKVIGEGANLGLTQLGRIEYAQRGGDVDEGLGGRLNTDFIDNSAGVDCSDHEVNIKILLDQVVKAGDMTGKQRDTLLEKMTDEVSDLVLRDNYMQTQALSMTMADAAELFDQQWRFIKRQEKVGRIDRKVEDLPNDEEMTERAARKLGLSRPELSVVFSYAKIDLFDALMASDLPDDPTLEDDLTFYFPTDLQAGHKEAITSHRLRREIIATVATNSLVNRAGPTFVSEIADKTGMGPADITRAYTVVRDTFGLRELWAEIEALDNAVDAREQLIMLKSIRQLVERGTTWLLRNGTAKPGGTPGERLPIGETVGHYKPGIELLIRHADELIHTEAKSVLERRVENMGYIGIPAGLARRCAALNVEASGFDLVRIADACETEPQKVGRLYFDLGYRLGLSWLRDEAKKMGGANHWQKQAVEAGMEDLYALQAEICINAFATSTPEQREDPAAMLHDWVERRRAPIERIDQLINELKAMDTLDVSMLAVANRRLRGLVSG